MSYHGSRATHSATINERGRQDMARAQKPIVDHDLVAFTSLINELDILKGSDGDTEASFPRSDVEDFSKGARAIPNEVTSARRAGQRVNFVTKGELNCWYWEMSDGSRIYHRDLVE